MMEDNYDLIGFVNLFKIIPDFIIPIFINGNDYSNKYIQYFDNELNICFEKISSDMPEKGDFFAIDSSNYKIRNLSTIQFGKSFSTFHDLLRVESNDYFYLQTAIYAFQNNDEIVYGGLPYILKYINNLATEDKYLIEEINDFKETTKILLEKFSRKNDYKVTDLSYVKETYKDNYFKNIISRVRERQNGFFKKDLEINPIMTYREHTEYIPFLHANLASIDQNFLVELWDNELKKYHYNSDEYKYIIKILYSLLFNVNNKKFSDKEKFSTFLNDLDIYYRNRNND